MIGQALSALFAAIDNAARWWMRMQRPVSLICWCGHSRAWHHDRKHCEVILVPSDAVNILCQCRRYEASK